jgi:hypothetical protein
MRVSGSIVTPQDSGLLLSRTCPHIVPGPSHQFFLPCPDKASSNVTVIITASIPNLSFLCDADKTKYRLLYLSTQSSNTGRALPFHLALSCLASHLQAMQGTHTTRVCSSLLASSLPPTTYCLRPFFPVTYPPNMS